MKSTASVVVIGAGVIGCSSAYHLAKNGISDVIVIEMEQVGAGTSSKSASMLSLQFGRDPLLARMAQYSYGRYMQFEEELGTRIDFHKTGWMSVASGQAAADLREHAKKLQEQGIATEILSPREIKYRYPELNTNDLEVGTFGPDDGPFDPHMIMWGYIQQATRLGASIRQREKACGLRIEHGRITGVETTNGFISSPIVVNAAGPWAAEVGRWVGIEIPLTNKTRTIVVTGPVTGIPLDRPFLEDETVEWYFRPETGGVLMGMGNTPAKTPEAVLDAVMVNNIIDHAIYRVPVLEQATLKTSWSGVRPLTVDGRPIIGKTPNLDGFLFNCGWGGMGIIQAPIAGQLLLELVQNGHTSTIDGSSLGLARFSEFSFPEC